MEAIVWCLILVLIAPPIGIIPMHVLNTFATQAECAPERDRVGFAMADAYPHDRSFTVECLYMKRGKIS